MYLCKYQIRDKQGQGIQIPLNCTLLSFTGIAFAIFLISKVATKLLLVITLLITYKKVHHRLLYDALVLCSKSESISDFQKRLATSQSDLTLPRFSRLLVAKSWAQGSGMSHNLTVGTQHHGRRSSIRQTHRHSCINRYHLLKSPL